MEIKVIRKILTDETSIGDLLINGTFVCYTLEDRDRNLKSDMTVADIQNIKVYSKTAIPYGSYRVTVTPTSLTGVGERLIAGSKQLPLVNGVKGFDGIRIHRGNKATATAGCLLCGLTKGTDLIGDSTTAHNLVFNNIQTALAANETVTITYSKEASSDTRTKEENKSATPSTSDASTADPNSADAASTGDATDAGPDFTATFEQIAANIDNQEASEVQVTWGKKLNVSEDSNWIGLKQYLLYLATRYTPQSVFPFIELIPDITVDTGNSSQEERHEHDGETPSGVESNVTGKEAVKRGSDDSAVNNASTKFQGSVPPGFSQKRFEQSAATQTEANGVADLFNLDPYKDGINFIGEASESGKKVFLERGVGMRAYGQLVLNPAPIDGVASKPGAIGFTDLEVQAGNQADNGLALIKMTLVDVQGNKFTDINSPWSFIYDARPGSVGGDFWFRYGWQIRVPDINDKDDVNAVKFWNHAGWALFDDETGSFRNKIISQLIPGKNVITLTQAINTTPDDITDGVATLGLFDDGVEFIEEGGQVKVSRRNLNEKNYVKLSILNPELNMDEHGALTAVLSFRTTGAIVMTLPLDYAFTTKKVCSKKKILLGDLILAVINDMDKFGLVAVQDQEQRQRRSEFANNNTKQIAQSRNFDNLVLILGPDQGGNSGSIHPDQIVIEIPDDSMKELTTSQKESGMTLIRWFRQVLQENESELLSAATGSGSGINATWIISTTKELDTLLPKPLIVQQQEVATTTELATIQTLVTEKDVFSYRFQGSLVTVLSVEKTEAPNAMKIQADYAVGDLASLDAQDADLTDTINKPVTVADKKRNLSLIFAQMQNCRIECMAHPWIGPGKKIFIKGLGFFDGEYQVLEVQHKLNGHKFTSSILGARILKQNENVDASGMGENKKLSSADGNGNFAQNVSGQNESQTGKVAQRSTGANKSTPTTTPTGPLVVQGIIDKVK